MSVEDQGMRAGSGKTVSVISLGCVDLLHLPDPCHECHRVIKDHNNS